MAKRETPERVELLGDLLSIRMYLKNAVRTADKLGNAMVLSLVQEALEEIEIALDQIPDATNPDIIEP